MEPPNLQQILTQLDALRDTVATLVKAKDIASPPGPPATQKPLSRSQSLAEVTSDEDAVAGLRPALYPHPPKPQLDSLEETHLDSLDALKLDSFQGFFNLSMLLLVFALTYITVRNLREHGVLLDTHDFMCPQVHQDALWAGTFIIGTYASSFLILLLVRLWIERALSWQATCAAYAVVQATLLLAPVTFLYVTPTAPLPSASILMVTSIVMLKAHSYVATNYAMYQEHVSRHGIRTVDEARDNVSRLPLLKRILQGVVGRTAVSSTPSGKTPAPAVGGSKTLKTSASQARMRRSNRSAKAAAGDPTPSVEGGSFAVDDDGDAVEHIEETGFGGASPVPLILLEAPGSTGGGAAPTPTGMTAASPGGTKAQRQTLVRMWPANVTLRDYAYFLAVPTLVYEPRYPRTRRIRWPYVARKLGEMALCMLLQYTIMKQFMLPVLEQGTKSGPGGFTFSAREALETGFSMMRLAMPSLFVWLTGFYMLFHCWCNVLAEILRFADRKFYGTWWNATDLRSFWKLWNLPVHEWCLRHIFVELRHYGGTSSHVAIFGTFAFSAVFHELIFSVSFKTCRPWFFIGMLAQLPLIVLSQNLRNKRRGNLLVWWALFSGQPLLEVLYFREWFSVPGHDSFFCGASMPLPSAP